ncbi:hypothetical protein IE81DRAFT_347955 [Ceraceosorus guamensis]|uniref:Uncharacterized protein n=1 Tax=Ceraceosorus guamensis TaxID=1522189 RepID=A0A316VZP2_9BASI|nr:hypothetical protein IE81DRAFT_347955 [Ceraceosorus guamensis]PWN41913.1 hypothetical protein IE81DRAFT_347955 [Ceraceosorus guamensis]
MPTWIREGRPSGRPVGQDASKATSPALGDMTNSGDGKARAVTNAGKKACGSAQRGDAGSRLNLSTAVTPVRSSRLSSGNGKRVDQPSAGQARYAQTKLPVAHSAPRQPASEPKPRVDASSAIFDRQSRTARKSDGTVPSSRRDESPHQPLHKRQRTRSPEAHAGDRATTPDMQRRRSSKDRFFTRTNQDFDPFAIFGPAPPSSLQRLAPRVQIGTPRLVAPTTRSKEHTSHSPDDEAPVRLPPNRSISASKDATRSTDYNAADVQTLWEGDSIWRGEVEPEWDGKVNGNARQHHESMRAWRQAAGYLNTQDRCHIEKDSCSAPPRAQERNDSTTTSHNGASSAGSQAPQERQRVRRDVRRANQFAMTEHTAVRAGKEDALEAVDAEQVSKNKLFFPATPSRHDQAPSEDHGMSSQSRILKRSAAKADNEPNAQIEQNRLVHGYSIVNVGDAWLPSSQSQTQTTHRSSDDDRRPVFPRTNAAMIDGEGRPQALFRSPRTGRRLYALETQLAEASKDHNTPAVRLEQSATRRGRHVDPPFSPADRLRSGSSSSETSSPASPPSTKSSNHQLRRPINTRRTSLFGGSSPLTSEGTVAKRASEPMVEIASRKRSSSSKKPQCPYADTYESVEDSAGFDDGRWADDETYAPSKALLKGSNDSSGEVLSRRGSNRLRQKSKDDGSVPAIAEAAASDAEDTQPSAWTGEEIQEAGRGGCRQHKRALWPSRQASIRPRMGWGDLDANWEGVEAPAPSRSSIRSQDSFEQSTLSQFGFETRRSKLARSPERGRNASRQSEGSSSSSGPGDSSAQQETEDISALLTRHLVDGLSDDESVGHEVVAMRDADARPALEQMGDETQVLLPSDEDGDETQPLEFSPSPSPRRRQAYPSSNRGRLASETASSSKLPLHSRRDVMQNDQVADDDVINPAFLKMMEIEQASRFGLQHDSRTRGQSPSPRANASLDSSQTQSHTEYSSSPAIARTGASAMMSPQTQSRSSASAVSSQEQRISIPHLSSLDTQSRAFFDRL